MDINKIETELQKEDLQYRIKAIAALKEHPPDISVPLLVQQLQDPEFLVRTFVARVLGQYNTSESFAGLVQAMAVDDTPSVRAEASNSLSMFGSSSISHLVETFTKDHNWLVRRSILAALVEMDCPDKIYEVCVLGLAGEDFTVQEAAIDTLGTLARSPQAEAALSQLLKLKDSEVEHIRVRVAYTLKHFDGSQVKKALAEMREDSSHRVIRAAMEDLIS